MVELITVSIDTPFALLRKGRVYADGDEFNHLVEALVFLAEVMGLLLAHLGVERRDNADNPDLPLAGRISKVDERVVGLSEFDAPQLVADFDAVAGKWQRTAFEQDVVPITGGRTAVRH